MAVSARRSRRFIDRQRQTKLCDEAVEALTRLAEAESVDIAHRASCIALAEWMEPDEWKRVGGRVCWRRVVGRACGQSRSPYQCNCDPPGTDHPSLWRTETGQMIYVSQPYDLSTQELREMVEFADANGLEISIRGTSWYYPGATVLVLWRKKA